MFLDLKPRGRYVMWHSWGNPLRRHCVQGAVPLHFFLLSLQNEHAVQNRNHKSVNHVLHQTSGTRSIPTLCRSLALALVDFRSRHVTVALPALVLKMEEQMYHATRCMKQMLPELDSRSLLLYRPKQSHGTRTITSRPLSDFVQPLADPAGVWHVLDNGCGRTLICLYDPACLDQGLHFPCVVQATATAADHFGTRSPT